MEIASILVTWLKTLYKEHLMGVVQMEFKGVWVDSRLKGFEF